MHSTFQFDGGCGVGMGVAAHAGGIRPILAVVVGAAFLGIELGRSAATDLDTRSHTV